MLDEKPMRTIFHKLVEALRKRFSRDSKSRSRKNDCAGVLNWSRIYLPEHFSKQASVMHRWLAGELEAMVRKRGSQINLIGPRGAAKSTVATLAYVLQQAVENREPYIWIVSDTKLQAQAHLENVKMELISNKLLAEDYPNGCGQGPRWRVDSIELCNGVVIEAFGTGQKLRGRRSGSHRPSLIICDDLQNDRHIVSPTARDSSAQWFFGTLLKSGDPKTNIVHLATALHRDALAFLLLRNPSWKSKLFKSIIRWPTNAELWKDWETIYCDADNENHEAEAAAFYQQHQKKMADGAVVLWPELESLYTLMRMRVESGTAAFAREKQSEPIDPERCEWPEEYFGEEIWFNEWPEQLLVQTIALDPSKGNDSQIGDYSAFVILGVDLSGVVYLEADLARRPTPRMVADGIELIKRFHPNAFGVEANQFQELLCDEFLRAIQQNPRITLHPAAIKNNVSKTVRIRRLGPLLAQRKIRFHRNSPGTQMLVDQLRDFPIAAHDDGPDAAEMALRLAEEVLRNRQLPNDGLGDRLVG